MKRFALNLGAFFGAQTLLLGVAVWQFDPGPNADFLAASIEKHRRLEDTLPPRIILVGGSSMALGMTSEQLEAALKRPVINMALMVPLGMGLMMDEIRGSIGRGDIVVLGFEYLLFNGGFDRHVLHRLAAIRPASLLDMKPAVARRLIAESGLQLFASIVHTSVNRTLGLADSAGPSETLFLRSGFNHYGDFNGHHGLPSVFPIRKTGPREVPTIRPYWLPPAETVEEFKRFAAECSARGARVVYTCPPMPEDYVEDAMPTVRVLLGILRRIPGLAVIDGPEDHAYPRDQFFDSEHHLTKAGARVRTEKLIRELRPFVAVEAR